MEMGRLKKRRKQRKRKHKRGKQRATAATRTPRQQPLGEIWSSTYKDLMEWHQQQVLNFCGMQEESSAEEEEEVNEEESNVELEEVDADYLSFLEVTLKHQRELQELRAAAAAEASELTAAPSLET
ncbi:hypothetical protein KR215_010833 [Drosophila sulfurigaster]|nr:hypothetical protein KR215_010833 [Drosophila sulfurigaster]